MYVKYNHIKYRTIWSINYACVATVIVRQCEIYDSSLMATRIRIVIHLMMYDTAGKY